MDRDRFAQSIPGTARVLFIASWKIMMIFLLAHCGLTAANDKNHPPNLDIKFEIHVEDITTRQLLHFAVDRVHQDLIIGDELDDRRVSVDEQSISANQLISQAVGNHHLVMRNYKDILLIASACRLAQDASVPEIPGDREVISFNYQTTRLAALVDGKEGAFATELKLPIASPTLDLATPITIAVFDGMARDELIAVATVLGLTIQPVPEGGVRILPNKGLGACAPHATTDMPKGETSSGPMWPPPERHCPDYFGSNAKCDVLEEYDIKELKLRGHAQVGATRLAAFETGEGFLVWVKEGNYIGRDFGKIDRITKTAVIFIEEVRDRNGIWKHRTVKWSFPWENSTRSRMQSSVRKKIVFRPRD